MSHATGNALILHPHSKVDAPDTDTRYIRAISLNDPRFITHLIATRDQDPQMRSKIKAAPELGAAAYRASGEIDFPANPQIIKRSV